MNEWFFFVAEWQIFPEWFRCIQLGVHCNFENNPQNLNSACESSGQLISGRAERFPSCPNLGKLIRMPLATLLPLLSGSIIRQVGSNKGTPAGNKNPIPQCLILRCINDVNFVKSLEWQVLFLVTFASCQFSKPKFWDRLKIHRFSLNAILNICANLVYRNWLQQPPDWFNNNLLIFGIASSHITSRN